MQVNVLEAKNRLCQLIRAAQAGEDVVIANRGEPVARLVPVGQNRTSTPNEGDSRAILAWLRAHPLPPYARRTADEIDTDLASERASWD